MSHVEFVEAWDPLEPSAGIDIGLVIAAKKREIANILRSYTGYYDLFSELIQNALDAVERRSDEFDSSYQPCIWIEIDFSKHEVCVTDNGCGMSLDQFRQFLSPSFSFKSGQTTRGSKGVGATYLGYGFNNLHVSSRQLEGVFSGRLEGGRNWIEDRTGTVVRPKIVPASHVGGPFLHLDRGTAVSVTLTGVNIRPKNLAWYQATSAEQWLSLLRILTPLGGLYINGSTAPAIDIAVKVRSAEGVETVAKLDKPDYLYPHEVIGRSGSMVEFLKDQEKRVAQGADLTKVPPKFKVLNGLWGRCLQANFWARRLGIVQ